MSANIQTPKFAVSLAMTGTLSYSTSYNLDSDSRVHLYSNSLEQEIVTQTSADFISKQVIEEEVSKFIEDNLHKSLKFQLNIYADDKDFLYVDLIANEDNVLEIYNYSEKLNKFADQNKKKLIFVVGE